jgi:type I restriction enzyme S subunit
MRKYQKSRTNMIDEIPLDWEMSRLKMFSKIFSGGTPDKNKNVYWENGTIPWIASGEVNQEIIKEPTTLITEEAFRNSSAKWIPKNSLVMALAGQGRTKGTVALLGIETTCNQSLAAIVPKNINSKFTLYWLKSKYQEIRGLVGEDRDGLNLILVGNIPIPLPPKEEQHDIVRFLDYKTGQIDSFIANRQKQIELLKEQKAAIINKAVTKGINPNAKMKNSGIEWIGEVPEHWMIIKLKYIAKIFNGQDQKNVLDENGQYPIFGSGGIFGYANQFLYEGPSVLLGRKGTVDKPRLVTTPFWSVDTAYYTKISNKVDVVFFYYLCSQINFDYYIYGSAIPSMTARDLNEIEFPLPEIGEQQQILEFIKTETSTIDTLISKYQKQIDLMQEYRTSLISQAVTGKIDVRDWQPKKQ